MTAAPVESPAAGEPTVEDKDRLAEVLADSTVPWLTLAVHLDDAEMVAEQIEHLDRQELLALTVVLASRCPRPLMRPDDGHIDDIAVRRACAGEKVPLTRRERHAAVALLRERRLTAGEIATVLHMSWNTADRLIQKTTANALTGQDDD